MLAGRQFNVRTENGRERAGQGAIRDGRVRRRRGRCFLCLQSAGSYMNMNSCSYYECDLGSGTGSNRLPYLAGRYSRFAFRGAAPFTSWRLEGDANSICGDVSADRVGRAAFVLQVGVA